MNMTTLLFSPSKVDFKNRITNRGCNMSNNLGDRAQINNGGPEMIELNQFEPHP